MGRAERSITKAAKNQRKQVVAVRRDDIDNVDRAIHGHDYALEKFRGNVVASDKTIEEVMKRNLDFVYWIREHRCSLLKSHAAERDLASKGKPSQSFGDDEARATNSQEEMNNLVAAVLAKLGINAASAMSPIKPLATASFGTPGRGKRSKAAVLQKLSTVIAEDIENHENEVKQTYQRATGFWRFANHEILIRLAEHARKVDCMAEQKAAKHGARNKDKEAAQRETERDNEGATGDRVRTPHGDTGEEAIGDMDEEAAGDTGVGAVRAVAAPEDR
jgi:hypothetical protein